MNKADYFAACNFYLFLGTYVSLTVRALARVINHGALHVAEIPLRELRNRQDTVIYAGEGRVDVDATASRIPSFPRVSIVSQFERAFVGARVKLSSFSSSVRPGKTSLA